MLSGDIIVENSSQDDAIDYTLNGKRTDTTANNYQDDGSASDQDLSDEKIFDVIGISTLDGFKEIPEDIAGGTEAGLYQKNNKHLIAQVGYDGTTPEIETAAIDLAVFETKPTESVLDIYYETSTSGLVVDLNSEIGGTTSTTTTTTTPVPTTTTTTTGTTTTTTYTTTTTSTTTSTTSTTTSTTTSAPGSSPISGNITGASLFDINSASSNYTMSNLSGGENPGTYTYFWSLSAGSTGTTISSGSTNTTVVLDPGSQPGSITLSCLVRSGTGPNERATFTKVISVDDTVSTTSTTTLAATTTTTTFAPATTGTLSPATITAFTPSTSGSTSVSLTANGGWQITFNSAKYSASPSSGSGNTSVTVSYDGTSVTKNGVMRLHPSNDTSTNLDTSDIDMGF